MPSQAAARADCSSAAAVRFGAAWQRSSSSAPRTWQTQGCRVVVETDAQAEPQPLRADHHVGRVAAGAPVGPAVSLDELTAVVDEHEGVVRSGAPLPAHREDPPHPGRPAGPGEDRDVLAGPGQRVGPGAVAVGAVLGEDDQVQAGLAAGHADREVGDPQLVDPRVDPVARGGDGVAEHGDADPVHVPHRRVPGLAPTHDETAQLPRSARIGPAADGVMSKSKIAVGR